MLRQQKEEVTWARHRGLGFIFWNGKNIMNFSVKSSVVVISKILLCFVPRSPCNVLLTWYYCSTVHSVFCLDSLQTPEQRVFKTPAIHLIKFPFMQIYIFFTFHCTDITADSSDDNSINNKVVHRAQQQKAAQKWKEQ